MAVKSKKGKTVDKWRKKKYFPILCPKSFQERELGKALAFEPASLEGRYISTNLMVLTGNIKKQDINIKFKIDKVQGDTAHTVVDKYEVTPASIKRKVRRQRDRIDESFQCVTKDNKLVRIKPLVITAVKTSRLVKSALRRHLIRFVMDYVRNTDYDTLVMDVIYDKLQRDISKSARKIVPVRFVNIRAMKYIGEQKGAAAKAAGPAPEPEAAEDLKKEENVEPAEA